MRFAIKLALAFMAAGALVAAAPAMFVSAATAAPVQHAQTARVVVRNGHLAIAIPLRPGRNSVSEAVALNSRSDLGLAAASTAPEVQVRVGPHNCAGYNGEVVHVWVPVYDWPIIETWGTAWDDCYGSYNWPSTTYVYVSYSELDEPRQNFEAGSVHDGGSAGASAGISTGPVVTADIFLPSDIVVTACIQSIDGWACGAGQKV